MEDVNGYSLSRSFFDWTFENPEKITPTHIAMYFFIIEHCNRLGWKEKFGLPTTMVKDAIGIRNYRTYSNTLNDLVDWGFIIMIEKSKNQYSSNIIAIAKNTKADTKALDKALQKHSQKQSKSIVSINKLLNNEPDNNELNKYISVFEEFRKIYPGTKRGLQTEFDNFKKKHSDWKAILPLLLTSIQKEVEFHENAKKNNLFVPGYANLSTWINKRNWETEFVGTSNPESDKSIYIA